LKDRHANRSQDARLGRTGVDELGLDALVMFHGSLVFSMP
jgi:hypothetical protein